MPTMGSVVGDECRKEATPAIPEPENFRVNQHPQFTELYCMPGGAKPLHVGVITGFTVKELFQEGTFAKGEPEAVSG